MYLQSLKVEPHSLVALTGLGTIFFELSHYQRALELFDEVLTIDENHLPGLLGRAGVMFAIGLFQETATECRLVLKKEPKDPVALKLCPHAIVLLNQTT